MSKFWLHLHQHRFCVSDMTLYAGEYEAQLGGSKVEDFNLVFAVCTAKFALQLTAIHTLERSKRTRASKNCPEQNCAPQCSTHYMAASHNIFIKCFAHSALHCNTQKSFWPVNCRQYYYNTDTVQWSSWSKELEGHGQDDISQHVCTAWLIPFSRWWGGTVHNLPWKSAYYWIIYKLKHHKNCECCLVSLLIVRSPWLSWIQVFYCLKYIFSILHKITSHALPFFTVFVFVFTFGQVMSPHHCVSKVTSL